MGIAIGILLAVTAVAVITWPFVRRRPRGIPAHDPQRQLELRRARSEIYQLIRQLEADNGAGLVSDSDFRSQLDDLRNEAARLMMREAALAQISDPAAELEREIAAARAAMASKPAEPPGRDMS